MLFYCFIVSALVVLVSTLHLKWWKTHRAILLSSVLLGSLVTVMVLIWGGHECAEGKAPGYLAFVGGGLAGAVPWCRSFSMNIRRMLAFSIAMLFVTMVGLLEASYHSEGITGNPELANGRYWHTILTGQYPRGSQVGQREQAMMNSLRERVHMLIHKKAEEKEPGDAPEVEAEGNQPSK